MDPTTQAEQQASYYKILSNPRRLLILWILTRGKLSVNEIASHTGSTLQNVSQHLGLLKKAGILNTERDGQTVYYKIADDTQMKKITSMLEEQNVLINNP